MNALFSLTVLLFAQPPAAQGANDGEEASAQKPRMQSAWQADQASKATQGSSQSFRSTSKSGGGKDSGLTILDPELFEDDSQQSLVPEFHVVSPGETMWGLTGKYYRDPYQWPLIWSINEQITNAHWIFPGDRLRVRDGDGSGSSNRNAAKGKSGVRYLRAGQQKKGPAPSYLVQRSFFLLDEDAEEYGKIVGSERPGVMMAEGDQIYLSYDKNNPPVAGERLAIFQPTIDIRDLRIGWFGRKRRGKKLAQLVQVVAEVQIEGLDEKSAAATIVDSLRPVERGMWLGPLQPRYARMRQEAATVRREGLVLRCIDGRDMSGQRQFVVVNLGQQAGVRPGNLISVVRHGDAYAPVRERNARDYAGHPARTLATLMVVDSAKKASLAMVLSGTREVLVGDPVLLEPPRRAAESETKQGAPARR